jgi:hypothetical protein
VLSESSIKKAPREKADGTKYVYQCKNMHILEYVYKTKGKIINNIPCPFCESKGIINSTMYLKSNPREET